ncbi:MAG: family 1 glycosylhydrolase [Opitutaceae bacterium]
MNSNLPGISRRKFLTGMAALSVASLAATAQVPLPAPLPSGKKKPFPKGFRWGVAGAAHQIEGNNTNSDFWFLENIKPTIFVDRSGDACDSYHRYAEDIALLAGLGFDTYRFSIEWARIEPTRGEFSQAELDHYKRVIACCRDHGVTPAVTFMHSTTPLWFAMAGGWLNPEAPALFARYCSTAAKALASEMGFAFTLNEPQVDKVFRAIPGSEAYFGKQDVQAKKMHEAAAKALNVERFITMAYPDIDGMTPLLVAGHEQGYAAIKAVRSDLPVGVTLSVTDFQPDGEGSPFEVARRAAYGAWLDSIVRAADFTGVQNYRQIRIPGTGQPFPPLPTMPFTEPGDKRAALQRPEALRNTVEYIHAQTKKPVLVTENGLETENDERRIWYIDAALTGLQQCVASGVPVLGYLHWSILDNFEWMRGYKPTFGLVAVDRTTFKRTPKPSAAHLGNIARSNAI